jgi:spermidine/putrescine-binding protein
MVPSSDHVTILAQKKLLEPIDKTKLNNYKNLDPEIMQKCLGFDPGNTYSIPYFWGLTGLAYNKKYVPEAIIKENSWSILANPLFKDKQKIAMPADSREVIGAALIAVGYSPNETSDEALAKAEQTLKTWDANITPYDSEAFQTEIQDGTNWLNLAYIGDTLPIMQTNPEIGFILPSEGATLWVDSIVIPKNAEHKELAYKFIDFLLTPENSAINAKYTFYATPNKAAFNLLPEVVKSNPLIYPNPAYLSKCIMVASVGEDILKFDRIWQQISK